MIAALLVAVIASSVSPEGGAEQSRTPTSTAPNVERITVIEAERAFAADAQRLGQWTAFRKWAAPNAIMFVPEQVEAQTWLKDRADPNSTIRWQPTAAFAACDGWMAVTTGKWQLADQHGYFTTVWSIADPDRPRWRWELDSGTELVTPRSAPARVALRIAACGAPPHGDAVWPAMPEVDRSGKGRVTFAFSGDKTLQYRLFVAPDQSRALAVALWNGSAFEIVLDDRIPPPSPKPVQ